MSGALSVTLDDVIFQNALGVSLNAFRWSASIATAC